MPDVNWNKTVWGSTYDWQHSGEEWSTTWGGSEAQWFGSIFPRLHRFLPAQRILEIAPGYGRWTKYLISACNEFVGIDLSTKCVDACRIRFSAAKSAQFYVNDGQSLEAAPDRSFDFIFSFDSLVHAESDVMAAYVPQVLRKLSPGGVAFLHHSNFLAYNNTIPNLHGRAFTVSAATVADQIKRDDGTVLVQEIVNWGCEHLTDCLTLFSNRDSYPLVKTIQLKNALFMGEATLIQHFQSLYSKLTSEQRVQQSTAA